MANAVGLNDTEMHGRAIKVTAKRTNVPGMKARRPGGRGRGGMGFTPAAMPFDPWGMMGIMSMMNPALMGGRRPFRGGGGRGRGGRGRGGRPY